MWFWLKIYIFSKFIQFLAQHADVIENFSHKESSYDGLVTAHYWRFREVLVIWTQSETSFSQNNQVGIESSIFVSVAWLKYNVPHKIYFGACITLGGGAYDITIIGIWQFFERCNGNLSKSCTVFVNSDTSQRQNAIISWTLSPIQG